MYHLKKYLIRLGSSNTALLPHTREVLKKIARTNTGGFTVGGGHPRSNIGPILHNLAEALNIDYHIDPQKLQDELISVINNELRQQSSRVLQHLELRFQRNKFVVVFKAVMDTEEDIANATDEAASLYNKAVIKVLRRLKIPARALSFLFDPRGDYSDYYID
jgi:DNA helicase HerA-like ATPase